MTHDEARHPSLEDNTRSLQRVRMERKDFTTFLHLWRITHSSRIVQNRPGIVSDFVCNILFTSSCGLWINVGSSDSSCFSAADRSVPDNMSIIFPSAAFSARDFVSPLFFAFGIFSCQVLHKIDRDCDEFNE